MRRKKQRLAKWGLLLGSVLFSCGLAELAVRVGGSYTRDGDFRILGRTLRPLKVPFRTVAVKLRVREHAVPSYVCYDSELGWTVRPNTRSRSELYQSDADGARAPLEQDPESTTRGGTHVALFGDSFTHGYDVPFEHSWGELLENNLNASGGDVEVLNFGVAGYGVGQAYLRWQKVAAKFAPKVVVFGFCPENVKRTVNVVRPLYVPEGGIPYSKPRFVLRDGKLELVNMPTMPSDKLLEVLKNFPESDLAQYEFYFDREDYVTRVWHYSKFATLVLDLLRVNRVNQEQVRRERDLSFYDLDNEPCRLTLEIVAAFKQDVERSGARFLIVHLPARVDVETLSAGDPLPYAGLLAQLDERFAVVHPEAALRRAAEAGAMDDLFAKPGSHYSLKGSQIVADELSGVVRSLLAPPPPR